MDLFDLEAFKYSSLVIEPLLFQQKLKDFFDLGVKGLRVIKAKNEFINHSFINGEVYLEPGAVIKPFSYINGRVLIGKNSIIGPQALIRGDVLIGHNSILSRCEVKNSIIMDEVNIHHHSYIDNSIIGNRVNIAAGFVAANLRFDKARVKVKGFGLAPSYKFGALIGDDSKTMVNASLMPGSVIPKGGLVNA